MAHSDSDDRPAHGCDVSVLFATCGRAGQLRQTLAAYERLDTRDLTWELIVVDNASADETPQVLAAAHERLPLRTLYVAEGGQNRARNRALDDVHGALVIFTDDDVIPDPQCLKAYVNAAGRWPNDVIFGARIAPRFPSGTPEWMTSSDFDFSSTAFARYAPREDEGPVATHPYGPSFAVRANALAGRRFPEHLGPQAGSYAMGGEGAFLREIAANGHRYIHVPAARVEHIVRVEQIEPGWLLARARKKGRGQAWLPTNKKPRRLFVGGVSVKLLLAVARAWCRYRLAGLLRSPRERLNRGIVFELRLGQALEQRRKHS